MTRTAYCVSVCLTCLLVAALIDQYGRVNLAVGARQVTTLPGARAEINAAHFGSLQAAVDALPEAGGLVRIPPGHFKLEQPLRIRSGDVCLVGSGSATHIENANREGEPAILLAHSDAKAAGSDRDHSLWRIRLADFRVTGNPRSGHGIQAHAINEIFVDGVTCSYHGQAGILLDYCYEDPRVVGCLITYNAGVGLDLQGCHDIVVSANQFEENQDAVHCFDGFNLCMTGNNLDDHLGRGVVIENTYGSVLSGNMIEECASTAVELGRDCYGITISANVIAHNGGGVDLRDAHGCSVSANTFTIMKTAALRIGAESGRIAVTGNSFCDSYIGEGVKRDESDRAAAGLVLAGGSDLGISGNVFSGLQPKSVALESSDASGIIFSSNLIVDSTSDHAQLDDGLVQGNLER